MSHQNNKETRQFLRLAAKKRSVEGGGGLESNRPCILCYTLQGRSQDLGGGGKIFLLRFGKFATRLARGVRGHVPPHLEKIFK